MAEPTTTTTDDPDAPHPVDPASAVLGVLAVAAGGAVVAGVDLGANDLGWAVAAGVTLLGISLVPWRR